MNLALILFRMIDSDNRHEFVSVPMTFRKQSDQNKQVGRKTEDLTQQFFFFFFVQQAKCGESEINIFKSHLRRPFRTRKKSRLMCV